MFSIADNQPRTGYNTPRVVFVHYQDNDIFIPILVDQRTGKTIDYSVLLFDPYYDGDIVVKGTVTFKDEETGKEDMFYAVFDFRTDLPH